MNSIPYKKMSRTALGLVSFSGTTHPQPTPTDTMALTMTQVLANIRDDVEEGLRSILANIAHDHNLNEKELLQKYLYKDIPDLSPVSKQEYQPHPPEIPAPRPKAEAPQAPKKRGGRKPKFQEKPDLQATAQLTDQLLDQLTIPLLKEACKNRAITQGGSKAALVKRLQDHRDGKLPQVRQPAKKAKKAKRAEEPQHNHPLDDQTHPDCDQCKIYGNPADPKMQEEEFEVAPPEEPAAPAQEPQETQETEMQDELAKIIQGMNDLTTTGPQGDEYGEPPEDEGDNWDYEEPDDEGEDPLGCMEYGDVLDLED